MENPGGPAATARKAGKQKNCKAGKRTRTKAKQNKRKEQTQDGKAQEAGTKDTKGGRDTTARTAEKPNAPPTHEKHAHSPR